MSEPNQPARRKRSRSRNRGKSGGGNASGGQKGRKAAPKVDPVEFWGDPTQVPEVEEALTSLGRPPVSGHETAAEHWFSLVYERAAFLAGALAAAGGLDENADGDEVNVGTEG